MILPNITIIREEHAWHFLESHEVRQGRYKNLANKKEQTVHRRNLPMCVLRFPEYMGTQIEID